MLVMPASPAMATDFTVTGPTPVTSTVSLGFNDTLTVTNSGTISSTDPAVAVTSNVAAGSVTNSGLIDGGFTGIDVEGANSDISGGIINTVDGTISGAFEGLRIDNSADISGLVDNSGLISGNTGIRVNNSSDITGGVTNSGTIDGVNAGIHVKCSRVRALHSLFPGQYPALFQTNPLLYLRTPG